MIISDFFDNNINNNKELENKNINIKFYNAGNNFRNHSL
jgi:hypothetical protein